jgi:hypothetical protein
LSGRLDKSVVGQLYDGRESQDLGHIFAHEEAHVHREFIAEIFQNVENQLSRQILHCARAKFKKICFFFRLIY